MSNAVVKKDDAALAPGIIEQVVLKGDLARLNEQQRMSYYHNLCQSLSLNPLTQPFEYIILGGRLKLYATRSCTDQLRSLYKISIEITKRERTDDFYAVTAVASTPTGRKDESLGVVAIMGLKGNELANALMKCETKAKRRVALSICGLGFLDENEPDTIADAKKPTAEEIYDGTAEQLIYTVPFGKYKDHTLEEISVLSHGEHDDNETALKGYMKYIRESAEKKGKEIDGVVKEFLENAEVYLEEKIMNEQFKAIK